MMQIIVGDCGCSVHQSKDRPLSTVMEYCPVHAAAPDMYKVCEALRRNKDPFGYDEGVYPMQDIYAMAEAVIARATPPDMSDELE